MDSPAVGVMLPGIGGVRKKAHNLKCTIPLQTLVKAFRMYADDNGGQIPEVTDVNQVPQQIQQKLLPYVSNVTSSSLGWSI
ncbi:hypothetical protein ACFL6U_08435 [Planctomycetota bacterium]